MKIFQFAPLAMGVFISYIAIVQTRQQSTVQMIRMIIIVVNHPTEY